MCPSAGAQQGSKLKSRSQPLGKECDRYGRSVVVGCKPVDKGPKVVSPASGDMRGHSCGPTSVHSHLHVWSLEQNLHEFAKLGIRILPTASGILHVNVIEDSGCSFSIAYTTLVASTKLPSVAGSHEVDASMNACGRDRQPIHFQENRLCT